MKFSGKQRIMLVLFSVLLLGGGFFLARTGIANPLNMLHSAKKDNPEIHSVLELNERTVNLTDTSTSHYLKLTIAVDISGPEEAQKLLDANKLRLNDSIINISSRYSYFVLLTQRGKASLKAELLNAFNDAIHAEGKNGDWKIKDVLFTDFVME